MTCIQRAWWATQRNDRAALRPPPHSSLQKKYGKWQRRGWRGDEAAKTAWALGFKTSPASSWFMRSGDLLSASVFASLKWGHCVLWCWGSDKTEKSWSSPNSHIPQPETRESRRRPAPLFLTSSHFWTPNLSWIHPFLFLPIGPVQC